MRSVYTFQGKIRDKSRSHNKYNLQAENSRNGQRIVDIRRLQHRRFIDGTHTAVVRVDGRRALRGTSKRSSEQHLGAQLPFIAQFDEAHVADRSNESRQGYRVDDVSGAGDGCQDKEVRDH